MKRPIVYCVLAVFLGCFFVITLSYNLFLGAALAALFFIVVFFTLNKIESFILCVFFIMGCLNFYMYYNINLPNNNDIVRIVQKKNKYCIATVHGKKVYLFNNIGEMDDGEKGKISGKFSKMLNYSKGTVGSYKVKVYIEGKKDFIAKMYDFKKELFLKYSKILGAKKTAILMGTCYGDTKYLSLEEKDKFKTLGISHIISVSGFHVALIYKIMQSIFGIKLGLIFSFLYVIFTGGKAATFRAYIMIFVLKLSKIVYKNYDALSSLSLAGLILLLLKPYYITDVGFILSFLATIGIILYNKKIKRILYKLPNKINESISISISAQIFTMPVAMCVFNDVSLFFIEANLILIPLYSLLILLGNLVIFTLKIPFLYKGLMYILYSVSTAINGANVILLKICPPTSKYNYFYAMSLLCMYLSYLFYKHGYNKAKYIPGLTLYFIILYNVI